MENKYLKPLWIEGYSLKKFIDDYIKNKGVISGYSARFEPFRQYTGYGISLSLWGEKSNEILNKIKTEYTLAPSSIKIDLFDEFKDTILSLRATSQGRVSYISGNLQLFHSFLIYYASILRYENKLYDLEPAKEEKIKEDIFFDFRERIVMKFKDGRGNISSIKNEQKKHSWTYLLGGVADTDLLDTG